MKFAEAIAHLDTLTAQACAQFAALVLPVLPMDGLAVVLLDPDKETSRVVFSLGDSHPKWPSLGRGRGVEALWGKRDAPPMCIPLQGREGEMGAVLDRGPTAGSYGPGEDALVRQAANRLAEVLENIQLRQRLDRMAEETHALDRIGEVVSSGGTVGRVYRRFAHEIRKVLDLHCLSIYVADPCSGRLIRVCRFGAGARVGPHELEGNRDLSEIGLPLPGSRRQCQIVQDLLVSTGEGWLERPEGPRPRSVMAVPVEYTGTVIGAVVAENRWPGAYGPENKKLLGRAAALLAAPMAKEVLYPRVNPEGVHAELAIEIARTLAASRHLEDVLPSLASALARDLSFDGVTLSWIDPNGWEIRTLRACPGTEDPASVLARDGPAAIHTQVHFQGQCIGMVDLWRKEGGAFTAREQEMLDYLGLQLAPLVQNARLSELAQRQSYQLTQLQQMGRPLDPFRGLDTVLREAVEEAARLSEGAWVDLYLYQEETLTFARAAATAGDGGAWRESVPHQIASLVESCFYSGGAEVLRLLPVMWDPGNGEIPEGHTGSCVGLALQTAQETIGVLVLGGRWGQEWSEAEVKLLEVFAGHVAEAIGEARRAQDQGRKGSRKQLESLRRELLTGVAGSLRQPMTSIKGYAESLLLSDVSWPEELRREFLETIGQQTDRLDQVVSDLLIPARWESGAVLLDPVVFTVKGLLDQAAVELEMQPRGRPVLFQCDPTLLPVLVDPQRIVQVILWLLQVADERLESDNTLRVEGDWEDGRILVSVGACVEAGPADNRDLVSVSSSRGGGSLRDNWRDTSIDDDLKLVACRHILEGHGVTLQAAPSPDVRDLFRFTLPPGPVTSQSLGRDW